MQKINTEFLIDFILKELKENRSVTDIPDLLLEKKISNEWTHFKKILEMRNLIYDSLTYIKNTKKEILTFAFSKFFYKYANKLLELEKSITKVRYDTIAHILKPRYRPHWTHSFLVGALGYWILNYVKLDGQYLKNYYDNFIKKKYIGAGYDLWDIWWTIALLHDIGYPVYIFWSRIELFLNFYFNYCYSIESIAKEKELKSPNGFLDFLVKNLLFQQEEDIRNIELLKELRELFEELQKDLSQFTTEKADFNFNNDFIKKINEAKRRFFNGPHSIENLPIRDDYKEYNGKNTSLRELLKLYKNRMYKKDIKIRKSIELDHGLISAKMALDYLKDNNLVDDNLAQLVFTPIVFHSLREIKSAKGSRKIVANCDTSDVSKGDFDVFFIRLVDELQEWGRGIITNEMDEILIESKSIILGKEIKKEKKGDNAGYSLDVIFEIENSFDVIERTNWSYTLFEKSKKKSFEFLTINGKPLNLNFKLTMKPHSL